MALIAKRNSPNSALHGLVSHPKTEDIEIEREEINETILEYKKKLIVKKISVK